MHVIETIRHITERIIERSKPFREQYLDRLSQAQEAKVRRSYFSCANQAHAYAACNPRDKQRLTNETIGNIGIITAYNDMLSAHQPFEHFPELIRQTIRDAGGVAQVAGGVPAMCDGITQGFAGMELSLFSRDVIALATSVGLSHDMFDAVLYLGVCDKIVPGLVMAALTFGHIPAIFVPAGPMTSGLPNEEKAKARQEYAAGKIDRQALLQAESRSYHAPGTCSFYGTANSNQMMMEIMGLHLPGSSFINPHTALRDALTCEAAHHALTITAQGSNYTPIGRMIDERSFVNAIVGLNATGGSTNHTIHLIAMAAMAGIRLCWQDIAEISASVPLICRIYPNGRADINHFHAAGGMGFVIRELLEARLIHDDVNTNWGTGLEDYAIEVKLRSDNKILREKAATVSGDSQILTDIAHPFYPNGGLRVLSGNLGDAVIKVSAVAPENWRITAPAKVFFSQEALIQDFKDKKLEGQDFIAVLLYQGPKANGMPELHKLTPILGILQDKGQKIALITDGRMSGASGKIAAAIHITPEALDNDRLAKIREGDLICLDAEQGILQLLVDEPILAAREKHKIELSSNSFGTGRELFQIFRETVSSAATGAMVIKAPALSQ